MATDREQSTSRGRSSYRFLLGPKWIAFHLLIILVVVVMINLAFWQLRRLDQRRQFNAEVRANASQPVTPIAQVDVAAADASTVEWRNVEVTGTYVPGHEFLVVNRAQNGRAGRNVVDALRQSDGSLVLINRGFVPQTDDVPALPAGQVTVVGRLRESERRKTGQPSDPSGVALTEVFRIEVPLLSAQFDDPVLPMYVEQLESRPADAPVLEPIIAPTLDEGPHLSYTVQWFIFSICVLVGWVLAVRRSAATRSNKPPKRRKSAYVPIADDDSVS